MIIVIRILTNITIRIIILVKGSATCSIVSIPKITIMLTITMLWWLLRSRVRNIVITFSLYDTRLRYDDDYGYDDHYDDCYYGYYDDDYGYEHAWSPLTSSSSY